MNSTQKQVPVLTKDLQVDIRFTYDMAVAFPIAIAELSKGLTPEALAGLTEKVKSGKELTHPEYALVVVNNIYKSILDAAQKSGSVSYQDFSAESILGISGNQS